MRSFRSLPVAKKSKKKSRRSLNRHILPAPLRGWLFSVSPQWRLHTVLRCGNRFPVNRTYDTLELALHHTAQHIHNSSMQHQLIHPRFCVCIFGGFLLHRPGGAIFRPGWFPVRSLNRVNYNRADTCLVYALTVQQRTCLCI